MSRKIDRDDYVWMGDHHFNGKVTGLTISADELDITPGDIGAATAAQGALADTAVQPSDLATVATSGSYADLTNTPTLGTAAAADTGDFATAAQGSNADSAVQPGDLAPVATSGTYDSLLEIPTTFPPAAHTHSISQVTNLQTTLDDKLTATQGAAVADSTAEDIAGLVADFNSLLASLRTAGILST